ncbi:DUF4034 domain-containing protein [Streptomyces sp. SID13666]|uniref:DUF4034 domain-containing protein n=1 Tax=unclassified Streptomyces TaxID=2593676 RepID=UPI0013C2445E|nr:MULTISPECIES: DUF4034 domain-containing protein [unclassified Streptomyces]NEA58383.1 DUF4034 domain-containing protein [Streptomyces sp. SID13666]NEA73647.1 DUF4034 domain-containing protein [Streptomyces sp. SID13588]
MARLLLLIPVLLWVTPWLVRRFKASRAGGVSTTPPEPGLLPQDRQNTKRSGPDPELDAVLAAVRSGDWVPAAQLLDDTGDDWERRDSLANALGKDAADDDTWLKAWQAERPDDPTAAVVEASALVRLAWNIRGGLLASQTTQQQFQGFHGVLLRAQTAAREAVRLAPEDPCAHMSEQWVAIGLGYSHKEFRALWAEIDSRAPHHFSAHLSALQYWCAKWRGSEQLANSFAADADADADAVAAAPAGSLLTVLPLISWFEHHNSDAVDKDYRTPEMRSLVDALLADVAAAPAGHLKLRYARHLLAYFLYKQNRYQEAVVEFRLVDGWVDAYPWRNHPDPAKFYCAIRNLSFARAK